MWINRSSFILSLSFKQKIVFVAVVGVLLVSLFVLVRSRSTNKHEEKRLGLGFPLLELGSELQDLRKSIDFLREYFEVAHNYQPHDFAQNKIQSLKYLSEPLQNLVVDEIDLLQDVVAREQRSLYTRILQIRFLAPYYFELDVVSLHKVGAQVKEETQATLRFHLKSHQSSYLISAWEGVPVDGTSAHDTKDLMASKSTAVIERSMEIPSYTRPYRVSKNRPQSLEVTLSETGFLHLIPFCPNPDYQISQSLARTDFFETPTLSDLKPWTQSIFVWSKLDLESFVLSCGNQSTVVRIKKGAASDAPVVYWNLRAQFTIGDQAMRPPRPSAKPLSRAEIRKILQQQLGLDVEERTENKK